MATTRVTQNEKRPGNEDTSAADEPTAMWGAEALKDLGLEEASKQHEDAPISTELDAPITQPTIRSLPKSVPKKKPRPRDGISLPLLILIATALGVAVYFGVSLVLG